MNLFYLYTGKTLGLWIAFRAIKLSSAGLPALMLTDFYVVNSYCCVSYPPKRFIV